ncbi:MAG: cyclic nucleotide-binding domain-containing protein [Gammaproteobacteria bacterium]|nr:cyclic nucleotide-binding domain-containing protein [Gammaproteobacteria bacterium]
MPVTRNPKKGRLVSLPTRKQLVRSQPIFSKLRELELTGLAGLAFEKQYSAGERIVSQNDVIDAIYIIVKGRVEVVSEVNEAGKITLVPQTVLKEGQPIGLSDASFFSPSGTRTTTLTALSSVLVIGWKVESLYIFLRNHPTVSELMQESAKFLLRMNFVKQVGTFSKLPLERLAQLARNIQEKYVAEGSVLFQQGEEGQDCYLISSGKVEIVAENEDGTEKLLAVLEHPAMFGEIAPLAATHRNATARMKEAGELFILTKEQLQELLSYQDSAGESIVMLMVERSRPLRLPYISYYHKKMGDGRSVTILKNPQQWRYFLLSDIGWLIWQQLDGRQTIEDIIMILLTEHKIFAPDEVSNTILNLANSGFISLPAMNLVSEPTSPVDLTRWQRFKVLVLKKFRFKYIFKDIDHLLSTSYNAGVNLLFKPFGQILIALIVVMGVIAFVSVAQHEARHILSPLMLFILIFSVFLMNLLLIPLHELGHAFTTKAFGREVHHAGLIFNLIGLFAFVDTTDMCLSSKKNHIIVHLAGAYTDIFIAGLLSIVAWLVAIPLFQIFCWTLALLLYMSALKNLNPLYQGDGYHALADALEKPKLHPSAFQWLRKLTIKNISRLAFYKDSKDNILFWVTSITAWCISILLALIGQYILLKYLPDTLFGISTYALSWILPALVIIRFVLQIVVSFRKVGSRLK